VARGLGDLDSQAWLFVVIIAIFHLVFDAIALIGGTPIQAMLRFIVVPGLALILALLHYTKEAFEPT
jgi:hypothetical protein